MVTATMTEACRPTGPGVAMGNCDAVLRNVADYVTATVDEDGIERALQHFGLV